MHALWESTYRYNILMGYKGKQSDILSTYKIILKTPIQS